MRKQLSVEVRLRQANTRLKNENKKLRARVKFLEEENKTLKLKVETLESRVEELCKIVFGGKNKGGKKDKEDKELRDKSSYRRSIPSPQEITKEETYNIYACPDCGSFLIKKYFITRYIEDILLPCLDTLTGLINAPGKEVLKQQIEKGWCPKCKCWHTANLPDRAPPAKNNEVLLGIGIRRYIAYKTYILRLSVDQIKNEIFDLYNISISGGEIINVLAAMADNLSPEYERLLERIQQSKINHMDETSWRTRGEKNFVWLITPEESEEAVFLVGKNRGKGHAEDLLGDNYDGIRITDCYAAYKNLSGKHQVCWAHFIRKARDQANNGNLNKAKKRLAQKFYNNLKSIYREIKAILQTDFNLTERQARLSKLQKSVAIVVANTIEFKDPPKKLLDLANLLKEYKDSLFTCIIYPGVPAENNKAEQKIRHIVLKRKNCFGTQSDEGSKTFQTNVSVLLSLWWQNRSNFWPRFNELMM